MKRIIAGFISLMLLALTGCGTTLGTDNLETEDRIFETQEQEVTFYAFRYGDKCIETEGFCDIEIDDDVMPTDGAFYEITADVTYLDGGVAGYAHFPQIDKVISCKEISVDDLSFPSIEEEKYGMLAIGDYADADYILISMGKRAVYKDGKWIYHYENVTTGENYENICYNGDITKEQIYEGVAKGILCCEDYFVMPNLD